MPISIQNKITQLPWFVYMAECSDGSIYTGITNDIEARITKHNAGKGAKYTKSRMPILLKAFWEYENKSVALKEEIRIKKLSRQQKLKMIQ